MMQVNAKRNNPIYRISSQVRHTRHADSGVVIDIDRGGMFRLNHVGSRMLELSNGELGVAEIADKIATEFGTDIETTAQDVKEFFNRLKQLGVVKEHGKAAGHFSART